MGFILRTKLNNIFRTISFNEIELNLINGDESPEEKLMDAIIAKG